MKRWGRETSRNVARQGERHPYCIVQQGKVTGLCGMTDRQRLDLLKEVAATRLCDERHDESLKIMDVTDERRINFSILKIQEVIRFIETRLAELEIAKEELKLFRELDKEKKDLQHTIFVLDLEHSMNISVSRTSNSTTS